MATIYAFECIVTGKAYIGCTASKLNKRAREHRCLLKNGKHTSPLLQIEWDMHGEPNFEMKKLETGEWVTLDQKRNAEQRWMDLYAATGRLCNAAEKSFAPSNDAIAKGVANAHNERGNRWTEEANLRRSLTQKGIPKGHGAKISATKRARKVMR